MHLERGRERDRRDVWAQRERGEGAKRIVGFKREENRAGKTGRSESARRGVTVAVVVVMGPPEGEFEGRGVGVLHEAQARVSDAQAEDEVHDGGQRVLVVGDACGRERERRGRGRRGWAGERERRGRERRGRGGE